MSAETRARKRRERAEAAKDGNPFWKFLAAFLVAVALFVVIVVRPGEDPVPAPTVTRTHQYAQGVAGYLVTVQEWPLDGWTATDLVRRAANGSAAYVEIRCRAAAGALLATGTQRANSGWTDVTMSDPLPSCR